MFVTTAGIAGNLDAGRFRKYKLSWEKFKIPILVVPKTALFIELGMPVSVVMSNFRNDLF